MNISKLSIDSYKHIRNMIFDFTYPEGHVNEGEPLSKICIIGQSATGKTSILEMIKNSISKLDELQVTEEDYLAKKVILEFDGQLELLLNTCDVLITKTTITIDDITFKYNPKSDTLLTKLIDDKIRLLNLCTELGCVHKSMMV